MSDNIAMFSELDYSRRRFMKDFAAFTGWAFLGAAELIRSAPVAIAGDAKNPDKAFGGLKGRILYDGDVPERKEIDLVKAGIKGTDLDWFKSKGPILNEEWVVDKKTKAVQWVFVWLLPEIVAGPALILHESLKAIPEKEKSVVVNQEPTGYGPHTVALRAGQNLVMKNDSPVGHAFKLDGTDNNEGFNRTMPPKSEIVVKDVKAERSALQATCPPHPWERMWLRIFDHPYFAVTKADGTFEIPMIPAGKCRIVIWQETLAYKDGKAGRQGSVVTVEGAAVTDLGDIKIKPKDMP